MAKVEVEKQAAVSIVTLNRPEVHNAIDGETADMLTRAIEGFEADANARVLVLTGAGGKSFCAGADLKALGTLFERPDAERTGPLGFARLDASKTTIAAIDGYCFAGGLELACWCDLRIAGRSAEFGGLNRRWGVPFVDGGTQRLPRIVGEGNANYLLLTGVRIGAERAQAMGLVQEVVDDGRALERALELAAQVAAYPQSSLRADRAAARRALGVSLEVGLAEEQAGGLQTVQDPEMSDGLGRFAAGERPEAPRPPGE
jgi:enoyl-CoA hydratase